MNVEELARPKWLTTMGTSDSWPEPHYEISWHEFFRRWEGLSDASETRLIITDGLVHYVTIFWSWDSGLAVVHPGRSKEGVDKFGRQGPLWTEMPKFFRIGCEHRWCVVLDAKGEPINVYVCTRCRLKQEVDKGSSCGEGI